MGVEPVEWGSVRSGGGACRVGGVCHVGWSV